MLATLYFAWRIEDSKWNPIWVLLFESTKRDKFTHEQLNNKFSNIWDFEHIAKFTLPNIPSPHYDKLKNL